MEVHDVIKSAASAPSMSTMGARSWLERMQVPSSPVALDVNTYAP
jgi:hypothetical protein